MITLRQDKGSALTYEEVDNNFNSMMGGHNFLHIQDQKTQGTNGGTFTSGAWQTRDLNTVLTNTISGASLLSNQITLPAGKYYVEASAPVYYCGRHVSRLLNSTTDGVVLLGTSEFVAESGANSTSKSFVSGGFQVAGTSDFIVQHRSALSKATTGLGVATNLATEVYSDIKIWRIGNYVA